MQTFSIKSPSFDNRGILVKISRLQVCCAVLVLTVGVSWSGLAMLRTKPPSLCVRMLQPARLTRDDVCRVLHETYNEDDLEAIKKTEGNKELDSKLAFEYKHKARGDRGALYKYRNVVKGFAKINNIGVWNWIVILGGMTKRDSKHLCKLLSASRTLGKQSSGLGSHKSSHIAALCSQQQEEYENGHEDPKLVDGHREKYRCENRAGWTRRRRR